MVKSPGQRVGMGFCRIRGKGVPEEETDAKLPEVGGQGGNRQGAPGWRDSSVGEGQKVRQVLHRASEELPQVFSGDSVCSDHLSDPERADIPLRYKLSYSKTFPLSHLLPGGKQIATMCGERVNGRKLKLASHCILT